MQFITVAAAAVAFASGALAGASGGSATPPAPFVLNQASATTLVNQYIQVLQNQTINGTTPLQVAQITVAEDYHEYSDSITSLISTTGSLGVNSAPTASNRTEWYNGVIANPDKDVTTLDILVAGDDAILWYWVFPLVGTQQYPVKGFNLFRVDSTGLIYEADIEFNSIAWGADIHALAQYVAGGSSSSSNSTTATATASATAHATYTSSTTVYHTISTAATTTVTVPAASSTA